MDGEHEEWPLKPSPVDLSGSGRTATGLATDIPSGAASEPAPRGDLEARLRAEVLTVLRDAVTNGGAAFENPHLIRCWESLDCDKTSCREALRDNRRCWQVAGTYCGGKAQGDFVRKHADCSGCEVFERATPTLVEELGEHLNNLIFLLRQERERKRRDQVRIARLSGEVAELRGTLAAKEHALRAALASDPLTGLLNVRQLDELLEKEFGRCRRMGKDLALLVVDIDRFDDFNEAFGHREGDRVLRFLAELLGEATREADAAFRVGGEVFALLLPDSDETIAWRVGERVRRRFAEARFEIARTGTTPKRIGAATASVGICSARRCETASELRDRAGQAVYRAKADGGNAVVRWA